MADVYDGFISYSHAADDLLAPRLQSALQRFAKPWWKRRAVRIFRDESSLSANPHLWSSITEALDTSGWFVLLLSPDAAQSEWVNQEITYWVENRDPKKILPVVTDGTFGWDGEVTGDAVPDALRGVFTEEPRWVDLRGVDTETELDLQNPEFAAAVADIASTIRGIPKDELASEEVRQHRRTVRTAWAAGGLVTVLAIAAVGFGVQSSRSASLATARELAASAVGVLDSDPVLSKLLALEAIAATPPGVDQPVEIINSLWQAAATDRLAAVIDTGFEGTARIHLSDDGRLLVVSSSVEDVVRLYDTQTFSMEWEWRLSSGERPSEDTVWFASISSENTRVAVGVMDSAAAFAVRSPNDIEDSRVNRVVILDAGDGTEITAIEFGSCSGVNMAMWSFDDARLAVGSGFERCERPEAPSGFWIEVFETQTWESEVVLDLPLRVPRFGPVPEFDAEGRIHVFGPRTVEIYGANYELVRQIEGSFGVSGDATRDGAFVVASDPESLRTSLYDTDTGQRLTYLAPYEFPQIPHGLRFSSEDNFVIYGNDTNQTLVWDVGSAEIVYQLPGGTAEWVHLDEATMRAYTGHDGGLVKVWDLNPPSVGRNPVGDLGATNWVDANSFSFGPDLGAFVAADLTGGSSVVRFFDLSSGELIDRPSHPDIPSHDPERLTEADRIVPMLDGRFIYNDAGRWMAHDPFSGEEQFMAGCESDNVEVCNDTGDPLHVMAASVDGSSILARPGGEGDWLFFDGRTGDPIGSESVDAPQGILTFTDEWFLGVNDSQIYALDRSTGELLLDYSTVFTLNGDVSTSGRVAAFGDQDEMVIVDTQAWTTRRTDFGLGEIRAVSISPDDALLAVGDTDEIHIFDLTTLEVIQSVGVGRASDVHWLGPTELLVGTADGSWATVSLDDRDLIEAVRDSLLRGFTSQECLTYRIDPCPTLEELSRR